MAATKINLVDLDTAAKSIPADVPVAMLNLLKFKTQATYPEGSAHTNISGEQAYLTRYIPGVMEITSAWGEDSGASMKPLWVGKLQANMLAEPTAARTIGTGLASFGIRTLRHSENWWRARSMLQDRCSIGMPRWRITAFMRRYPGQGRLESCRDKQ